MQTFEDPPEPNQDGPVFAPDFAERVLRKAALTKRRRTAAMSLTVLVLCVGAAIVPSRLKHAPSVATPPAGLDVEDFAWLDKVGTSTDTPDAVLFPDESDERSTDRLQETVLVDG